MLKTPVQRWKVGKTLLMFFDDVNRCMSVLCWKAGMAKAARLESLYSQSPRLPQSTPASGRPVSPHLPV